MRGGLIILAPTLLVILMATAQTGPQRKPDMESPARSRRPAAPAAHATEMRPTEPRPEPSARFAGGEREPFPRAPRKATRKARKEAPAPEDPAVVAARAAEYEREHQRDAIIEWSIIAGILAAYFALCFGLGYVARQQGRDMPSYVLLSLLVTPFLALVILAIAGPDRSAFAAR